MFVLAFLHMSKLMYTVQVYFSLWSCAAHFVSLQVSVPNLIPSWQHLIPTCFAKSESTIRSKRCSKRRSHVVSRDPAGMLNWVRFGGDQQGGRTVSRKSVGTTCNLELTPAIGWPINSSRGGLLDRCIPESDLNSWQAQWRLANLLARLAKVSIGSSHNARCVDLHLQKAMETSISMILWWEAVALHWHGIKLHRESWSSIHILKQSCLLDLLVVHLCITHGAYTTQRTPTEIPYNFKIPNNPSEYSRFG